MDEPICSICRQVIAHPELRGKMFHRKGDRGFLMAFSQTLIQMAGGIDRLLIEWEQEPESPALTQPPKKS